MVPVKRILSGGGGNGIGFAPIGLIQMFNSGGAIVEVKYDDEIEEQLGTVWLKVRGGCGDLFGAYSTTRPKRVTIDSNSKDAADFGYQQETGLITIKLPTTVPDKELYNAWNITIQV